MWKNNKTTAIVLAGGSGKRMKSKVPKQYLEIGNKPVLFYSLYAFETCDLIDDIILVTADSEKEYCEKNIIQKYGLKKVSQIATGGAERYDSVYSGICAINECDYVLIHDGARPFVTETIISHTLEGAYESKACAAGMPSKDTIRIVDENNQTKTTPDRNCVWLVQTPQTFQFPIIKNAFDIFNHQNNKLNVTDDVMIVESTIGIKAKMVEGSYMNIKITTPEDIKVAETFLNIMQKSIN